MVNLLLFRRDLRLHDHPALVAASNAPVAPVFVLDPRQFEAHPYRSSFALSFFVAALKGLDAELRAKGTQLQLFIGPSESFVATWAEARVQNIHAHEDVTPFSRSRDEAIAEQARAHNLELHLHPGLFLHHPGDVLKDDGSPYTVFTPFFRRCCTFSPTPQSPFPADIRWHLLPGALTLKQALEKTGLDRCPQPTTALHHPLDLPSATAYDAQRDVPSLDATSRLSAHLKFGVLSPRQVRDALGKPNTTPHPILRQLHWRDFLSHIAHHFPRVFQESFNPRTHHVAWKGDGEPFQAWCAGQTGFPIVDAGMRQLVQTGRMHNRVRMVVASFLTKDLHVHWRLGERFFAQHLEDYDPALNNGNWQWAASTGCDAQPYFRIFNPWLQQKRFDPEATYIKTWVPELEACSPASIHKGHSNPIAFDYAPPLVEHRQASLVAKSMFTQP